MNIYDREFMNRWGSKMCNGKKDVHGIDLEFRLYLLLNGSGGLDNYY